MPRIVTDGPAPHGGTIQGRARVKFVQWLTLKTQMKQLKARVDSLREDLLDIAEDNGEPDSKGHVLFDFDLDVNVGDRSYRGLKIEKRRSTYLNEEKAEERLREKGVYEDALVTRTEIDADQIYVLYQQDKLDDDDIDYMFETTETYALKEQA